MRNAKLVAFLALISLSVAAWAQTASSSLNGTVSDPHGSVITGATPILSTPKTGFNRDTKTNGQGVYQFLQVPPATYELRVSAAGFAAQTRSNVVLMVNTPATLDVAMQIAGSQAVVEVTASAPLVNTQDASLGHAFNSDQISYLPFEGREAASILSLQPGVVYTGNSSHTSPASDSRSG